MLKHFPWRGIAAFSIGAVLVLLVGWPLGWIPTYAEHCEYNYGTGHEECTTYYIALVALRQIEEGLNAIAPALTAIATAFIGWFTYTLKKSTDRLWVATKLAADHIPNVERGYIVGGGPTPYGDGFACVSIGNYGKTVAILTKVEWGFCAEKDFPVDAVVSELLKNGRLKVDECREMEDVLPPSADAKVLVNTKFPYSKALGKIFFGKFTYSILFDSEEHFSTFKLRVPQIFPKAPSIGLPGSYSDWK